MPKKKKEKKKEEEEDDKETRGRINNAPKWREAFVLVEGLEHAQVVNGVANRLGRRRLQGFGQILLDKSQLEQFDLQTQLLQRRAQHLRLLILLHEVLVAVSRE